MCESPSSIRRVLAPTQLRQTQRNLHRNTTKATSVFCALEFPRSIISIIPLASCTIHKCQSGKRPSTRRDMPRCRNNDTMVAIRYLFPRTLFYRRRSHYTARADDARTFWNGITRVMRNNVAANWTECDSPRPSARTW